MAFFGNLKNTVAKAVNNTFNTNPHIITKTEVLGLEETERTRRINQAAQAHVDMQNAASVSGLIKTQSFPVFRGNVSKGYKRVTHKFEEEERRRRLTNKSESALRRSNANQTARMVQHLGWPFYQQSRTGAEYITMYPTSILAEEERAWRTSRAFPTAAVKHNAAMVANILRWENFEKSAKSGFSRHLWYLSEKERRYRTQPDVMNIGMQNAYNVAACIKKMGPPFFVQEAIIGKRDFTETHKLEERERLRRMMNPEEQQLAHELAGIVGQNFAPQQLSQPTSFAQSLPTQSFAGSDLEELERSRRLADQKQQQIAQQNARSVSLMVRESSTKQLNVAAPMTFGISRSSIAALVEIERTRLLRDIEGQNFARSQAKLVAGLFAGRTLAPTRSDFSSLMEEERSRRMVDRQGQQLALKNARKVSGLVARHNLMSSGSWRYFSAVEESERNRRLADNEFQSLAQQNARKVANLISTLNVAPGNQVRALPTYNAPVSAAPTSINIPSPAPIQSAPIQSAPIQSAPIVQPVSATIQPTVPIQQASVRSVAPIQSVASPLVASAPIQSAPLVAAPIQSAPISQVSPLVASAPIQSAPIQSAPIYSAPISTSISSTTISPAPIASIPIQSAPIQSAPIYSAPISAAPIYSAPISAAPIYSAPISSAPTYTAPISSAPIYTAPISSVQSYSTPTAPISSVPISSSYVTPTAAVQPIVLPATAASVPVVPLASTTQSMPTAIPAVRPIVPADPNNSLHFINERERKKLQKQVDRNNRKSERDIRKAEKNMLKAEKMHQKGRDDKAMKLESKAEKFMLEAEQKRKYATGLEKEVRHAPAPASM